MPDKLRTTLYALILVLYSLLIPGSGLCFSGKRRSGCIIYTVLLAHSVLFLTLFYPYFLHLVIFILFVVFVHLYSLVSTVIHLFNNRSLIFQIRNRWYLYPLAVVIHAGVILPLLFLVLSPLKPYKIPSKSMQPLLTIGDYFFVDKRYYKHNEPARSDVVVFQSPVNTDMVFVKRVVGLPGETIEAVNSRIIINGQEIRERYLVHAEGNSLSYFSKAHFGPLNIPEDRFFMLGDNRNNSYDSRNYGTVDPSTIKGKVLYVVWAGDTERIGRQINKK